MSTHDWAEYFSSCLHDVDSGSSLQEQLIDLSETVFSEDGSSFTITDITSSAIESYNIRSEHDFAAALRCTPEVGTRLISLHSDNSISPLNIESKLSEQMFNAYRIRPEFLRVLLSFGEPPHASEANSGNYADTGLQDGSYAITYKLNYVERNRRSTQVPWSTRQVGIYHHHDPKFNLIILLHCNPQTLLCTLLNQQIAVECNRSSPARSGHWLYSHPQHVHLLALSCYVDNWRLHLRQLGELYSSINDSAMIRKAATAAHADSEVRVQQLRSILDRVVYSISCCESTLQVLLQLKTTPLQSWHADRKILSKETVLRDFLSSSKSLQTRIQNTVSMVGDTLALQNHLETVRLDQEIRDMTLEMKRSIQGTELVTSKLKDLTENNVDDSAIVRVITIVSAFYLPGSFVSSIFGMNFFDFSGGRSIMIATDFWIFIVLWAVFTFLTALVFYLTHRHKSRSRKGHNRKHSWFKGSEASTFEADKIEDIV